MGDGWFCKSRSSNVGQQIVGSEAYLPDLKLWKGQEDEKTLRNEDIWDIVNTSRLRILTYHNIKCA